MKLEKQCSRCKEILFIGEFCKFKHSPDGRNAQCRSCKSIDQKERWLALSADERKVRRRKNKESQAKRTPNKVQARIELKNALKRKQLKRQPCVICGKNPGNAHHSDYNKPLEITWFCSDHHRAWHRVFVPIKVVEPIFGNEGEKAE